MAKQTINIGTAANDRTGDPLRTAFTKINSNFTELYTADTTAFASAAQGLKADTALQPAAIGTTVQPYSSNLSSVTFDVNGNIIGLNSLVQSSAYVINASNFASLDDALLNVNINQYKSGIVPKINLGVSSRAYTVSANSLKTCELVGTTFNTTYTSVASTIGTTNNYTVTLNVASTSNINVGDYIGLTPNGTLTGTNPLALAGATLVTAKSANTITFLLESPVAPSGLCAGTIKIYKSVISLSIPLYLTFDLRMKDIAIIIPPGASFFVSDNSTLTNTGGLFYGDGASTLYFSRGGQIYADDAFFSRLALRLDYGALGHTDNSIFRSIQYSSDAVITVSEASQLSAWGCTVIGGEVGVLSVSTSFISLLGTKIAYGNRGIKANIRATIDARDVTFIGVVGTTSSPALDTLGNANSYINSIADVFEV